MSPTLPALTAVIVAVSLLSACGNRAPSPNAAAGAPAAASGDAGTGSGPAGLTPPGAATAVEDCSYISAAQLSAIEGATYTATTPFHSICSWTGDSDTISITLTHNATQADWLDVLDTVQRDQATDPPTPIPGLGDRAAGTGREIAVQHGRTIIDIRDGDSPGYGKWPKSTVIANLIIASGKAN